ncbi:MAG: hypothetical protein RMK97_02030 [Sutterellaceae bacterium]|nr:hypothetical protein [Burkholderiaceae bacterium]MDW8429273.1 hypothetical protein [Sutterellaceae bacterium]
MTLDELQKAQNTPTDFSRLDAAVIEDAMLTQDARFAADSHLYVSFYTKPTLRPRESQEQGRPIYRDEVYVRILIPGDKQNQVDRLASEQDIQRFRKQYDAFLQGKQLNEGTPLEAVGFIPPSLVAELKHFNITTVEQLAEVNDGAVQNMQGLAMWRQKARAYVELTHSPEALHERVSKAEQENAELRALVERLQKKAKE